MPDFEWLRRTARHLIPRNDYTEDILDYIDYLLKAQNKKTAISKDPADFLHELVLLPSEVPRQTKTFLFYQTTKKEMEEQGLHLPAVGFIDNADDFFQLHAHSGYTKRRRDLITNETPRILMRLDEASHHNKDIAFVFERLAPKGSTDSEKDSANQTIMTLSLLHESAHVQRMDGTIDGIMFHYLDDQKKKVSLDARPELASAIQAAGVNQFDARTLAHQLVISYEETYADALAGIWAQKLSKNQGISGGIAAWQEMRNSTSKNDPEHDVGTAISQGFAARQPLWVRNQSDYERWADAKAKSIALEHTRSILQDALKAHGANLSKSDAINNASSVLILIPSCVERLQDNRASSCPLHNEGAKLLQNRTPT